MSFAIRDHILQLVLAADPRYFSLIDELTLFHDEYPDATAEEVLFAATQYCYARPDLRNLL